MEITKGEWKVSSSLLVCNEKARIIANCIAVAIPKLEIPFDEAFNNANLIAEAGTIANKTGLTPIQLLVQRDELLAACEAAQLVYNYAISSEPTGKFRNRLTKENILRMHAIAKAKG